MSTLGISLFWCFVQITLVGATAAIACLLLNGCQARMRNRLLQVTFLVTLGLSVLAFSPWPRWGTDTAADGMGAQAVAANVAAIEAVELTMGTQTPVPPAEATQALPAGDTPPEQTLLETASSSLNSFYHSSLPGILAAVILAGLVIGSCRCLIGVFAVRQVVRVARPMTDDALQAQLLKLGDELHCRRQVELRETDLLTTAATVGWWRPLILLPISWRSWSDEERRAVLAHELAHIVRQDFASLVMAQISTVLHFYHPLVHWLVARLRLEQELVADAMAARVSGGRAGYLTVLATMALREEDRPMGWPARSFLPTRGTFMRRIEMLRDSRQRTGAIRGGLAMAALTAVVVVGVLAAGLRSPKRQWAGRTTNLARAADRGNPCRYRRKPEQSEVARPGNV